MNYYAVYHRYYSMYFAPCQTLGSAIEVLVEGERNGSMSHDCVIQVNFEDKYIVALHKDGRYDRALAAGNEFAKRNPCDSGWTVVVLNHPWMAKI